MHRHLHTTAGHFNITGSLSQQYDMCSERLVSSCYQSEPSLHNGAQIQAMLYDCGQLIMAIDQVLLNSSNFCDRLHKLTICVNSPLCCSMIASIALTMWCPYASDYNALRDMTCLLQYMT
jgi:hypothetical protein